MKCHLNRASFFLLLAIINTVYCDFKKPTVVIGILVRNKAHILPYTLSYLEKLNYPKDRISLWIHSDNNVDSTIHILKTWLNDQKENYFSVNVNLEEGTHGHGDERGIGDWSPKRFEHVITLRDEVLKYGRKTWADYVFMLDADVLLTNPYALDILVSKNETIVAPLLKSDGMYSNFWAGMSDNYYYKRTDDYEPILNQQKIGCFPVPMVHSAVLIDLRRDVNDLLTYNSKNFDLYDGPRDDIITFALSAKSLETPLLICNDHKYGFVTVPLENKEKIEHDIQQLTNLKLEILAAGDDEEPIPISESLTGFIMHPAKDTLGLGNIYMINLERRPERRQKMLSCFDELGIEAEIIDAVDGRTLNKTLLNSWNIKMLPGYKDPYHKRPMTMGEVGCFLSHYIAWNRIVEDGHDLALILEDDVKFEPYFRQKVSLILQELEKFKKDWDLVYFGRKRMEKDMEYWVEGSKYLVYASYSYWTVGYMLSAKGAKKLLSAKPLDNLVPVDEYLPIMYDKHPRDDWKAYFENRNLIALSAEPLLLHPTHYTGEDGYISDTENSAALANEVYKKEEL